MKTRAWVAIAFGGLLGAGLRWATVEALPVGSLHWGLLAANTIGCAVFGFLFGARNLAELRSELHLAATTGFCGSLTTLSGFSVITADALRDGRQGDAVAFVILSLLAGLAATWSGRRLARAIPQ